MKLNCITKIFRRKFMKKQFFNKTIFFISVIVCTNAVLLYAEFVEKPDPNTLWIENGVDVTTADDRVSETYWRTGGEKGMGIEQTGTNGFTLRSMDRVSSTTRYMPIDPDYPYLVIEVTDFKHQGKSRSIHAQFFPPSATDALKLWMVNQIPNGIYTWKAFINEHNKPLCNFTIYLANSEVTLRYIKMVKTPNNYIYISSPAFTEKKRLDKGDAVVFTVYIAAPAEDVSLSFFHAYTMPQLRINGSQKIQLKPEAGNQNVWKASVIIETCEGDTLKPGKQFEPGEFIVKATVLGGSLKVPLYTVNPYTFSIK